MRISRQWNDLTVRKRFGFGHNVSQHPGKGDLALFCVACPQPQINLPLTWSVDNDKYVLLKCRKGI